MFIATSSHIRECSYDILANCLRLIEVFVLKVRNWVELINDKNLLFYILLYIVSIMILVLLYAFLAHKSLKIYLAYVI